jgi:hypothetical protein
MKASLKATLDTAMQTWLEEQDSHDDRPAGLVCQDLSDMMASAAAAVYDASHAGAMAGAKDPQSCGVSTQE